MITKCPKCGHEFDLDAQNYVTCVCGTYQILNASRGSDNRSICPICMAGLYYRNGEPYALKDNKEVKLET